MKKLVTLLKHNSEFFVIAVQIAPYIMKRKKKYKYYNKYNKPYAAKTIKLSAIV